MKDLFGKEVMAPDKVMTPKERRRILARGKKTSKAARASDLPGPANETCRSCKNVYYRGGAVKRYYKCGIARRAATGGAGTDIRLKDAACARWEKKNAS